MRGIVHQINTSLEYSKIIEWGKLISLTGSSQLLIQIIGFIGGILVIRLLPTQEYALYTLANTMLGTMIVLADGGVAASVLGQGGKDWQDRKKLGAVLVTGFHLRKRFATISLIIALPLLMYLLRQHNASWLATFLIIGALIPAFFATLSGNLLSIGPSLHQAVKPLQKIQVGVSVGRLLMLLMTLFIFPWAFIAILCSSLPQIWGNINLRKCSKDYADFTQKPDPAIQKEIVSFVQRILPGAIYYCLSGQLTIWLISIFGNTEGIAQIGALGRLSVMLGVFSSIFGTLIIPRFARLADDYTLVLRKFLQILFGLAGVFLSIVVVVSIIPGQLLWILGSNYAGLENEIVLSVGGSCLNLFAGLLFTISTCRNWAINPVISIPVTISAVVAGIFLINISSLTGILKFNIFVASIEVLIYIFYCGFKISKLKVSH
jgi:O-antigen/teichoic acid export membrane protein